MNYQVITHNQNKYISCSTENNSITTVQDILDLVAACGENETFLVMLFAENFTPDFYNLRTGLAGDILQKFVNYHIKTAAILPPEKVGQGKFYEMVLEANRGTSFHVFNDRENAEKWLLEN